jgi:uncharacterized membrane protein
MSSQSVPAVAVEIAGESAKSRPVARIGALDWTKGALVVCMVVYHSINYSAFRPMAFKALGFLPPSFILIAGFLVGQVYATKYSLNSWKPYARLLVRGFKLLLLFLILNIAHCIILKRDFVDGLWEFADRAGTIFLSGNNREGIFEVLLPIAYFLILAPALLWLRSRTKGGIAFFAGALFLLCLVLDTHGMSYKNLYLLSAGAIGMACGLVRIECIDRLASKLLPVFGVYAAYRLCSFFFGEIYPIQIFGALISLIVLYGLALHLDCDSRVGRQIVLLGKYSLAGYLIQIPLIQILVFFCGKPAHWIGVFAITLITSALLFIAVQGLNFMRNRNSIVDGAYKAVFA